MRRRPRHFVKATLTSWTGKYGLAQTSDGLVITISLKALHASGISTPPPVGTRLEVELISYAFRCWPITTIQTSWFWRRQRRLKESRLKERRS